MVRRLRPLRYERRSPRRKPLSARDRKARRLERAICKGSKPSTSASDSRIALDPITEGGRMNVSPKVAAAGWAGAVSVVIVYIAGLLGLAVPGEVASALTTLIAVTAGYIKSA
jgi:hypothetical protein